MLLNNEWVNRKSKKKFKNMETNENENTTVQNLWDAAKVVLRRKYIAIPSFLKKQERSQINNLTLHVKEPEKEQQTKPKPAGRFHPSCAALLKMAPGRNLG